MAWAPALALFASGCAVSQKKVVKPSEGPTPLQTATKAELVERYNQLAQAVTSLNAKVSMKLTAGSAYSGVIEQYHETDAIILASRPSNIRVIGQAPVVGKNIFDMVSDGKTFRIFIPSKHKFIEGPARLERPSKKPVENLRPQHILDALFWEPLPVKGFVLFEEAEDSGARYYVLTAIHENGIGVAVSSASAIVGGGEFSIYQKIWFDRSDLNVARVEVFAWEEGKATSDVSYSGWGYINGIAYARQITLARPADDYKLDIAVKKMTLNEAIAADKFVLAQPPGTELVRVGEDSAKEPQP